MLVYQIKLFVFYQIIFFNESILFLCNTYNQIFELENKEQNFCHTFLSIKRTLNEMILDKKKKAEDLLRVLLYVLT